MQLAATIFNKDWKIRLLLLVFSFALYSIFLSHQFLNLNNLLSSITLDSIKNYYTFVYHIKNDKDLLVFAGMNYPFSEHVVFTDCQPIVTFMLRLLPINPSYLIGTMHALLYCSFIITPLILFSICRRIHLPAVPAFIVSLALALLSPQFLKINAGHHALAYGCVIPISILLILRLCSQLNFVNALNLCLYHIVLFFLHPYFGFSLSLLSTFSLFFLAVLSIKQFKSLRFYILLFVGGILPLVFFAMFMKLTDHHQNRTTEPFGTEVMIENFSSIFAPDFGPFKKPLEAVFSEKPFHFEGHSYVGLATVLLAFVTLFCLPKILKRKNISPVCLALFLAATCILFISFGYHNYFLNLLGIKISAVSQFRAVCRFAWVFYFVFPLFLMHLQMRLLDKTESKTKNKILVTGSALFFILCLIEASAMFSYNSSAFWKFRNFFNDKLLTENENTILSKLRTNKYQAILPLPMFHGGSETYDRNGSSNSMAPAMLYSFHSGLPILSTMMSRTSITETENQIEIFNSYKNKREITTSLGKEGFFVIKTSDPLLPDEERLSKTLSYFAVQDSLSFSNASVSQILKRKFGTRAQMIYSNDSSNIRANIVFTNDTNKTVFTSRKKGEYETAFVLDSHQLAPGRYVISFHYYYQHRTFKELSVDLIVTEARKGTYNWVQMNPVRKLSGFYPGMGVYENFINIEKDSRYEFIFKMLITSNYKISNFMLRPDTCDIIYMNNVRDTVFNNFPIK